jgi:glycosyltransferase involved in cell wall biosynthesis
MKIAIVVQGRFHAFDLARALLARGHDVMLFTNYPKWAVKRFGIASDRVRSFWPHGVASRIGDRLRDANLLREPERWLHAAFGRWVSGELAKESWDVVHGWSGVSEEHLAESASAPTLRLIMRGSAHIRAQARIIEEEERRTNRKLDRPGPWITAREEREYEVADKIVVLSTFAYRSFLEQGVDPDKLRLLQLGTRAKAFRPAPEVIEARCRRILSGDPLRVLYVGTLSMRKGFLDVLKVVRTLAPTFSFRFVGPVMAEVKKSVRELTDLAELIPKQPHNELPRWYAEGDVFIFPTVEDGYAVVLAQAQASGLPVLTTTNCCGPDLICEGETGWVLPIRSPEAFIERLLWCDSRRQELVEMVRHSYTDFRPRDWADVAADFESLCISELMAKRSHLTAQNGR